jgi:hypothetical protein
MTAQRVEEHVGWVMTLDETACVDGEPCRLYLTPDGLLTPDIEQAEFIPDVTDHRGQAFFFPNDPRKRFTCLKVMRVLTITQKTELL